jgi:hypothetical protein
VRAASSEHRRAPAPQGRSIYYKQLAWNLTVSEMSSFWNYMRPITREQNIQGLPARRLIDLPDSPCTDIADRVRPNAPRVRRLGALVCDNICTRARTTRRVFETFVKLPRASHCSCSSCRQISWRCSLAADCRCRASLCCATAVRPQTKTQLALTTFVQHISAAPCRCLPYLANSSNPGFHMYTLNNSFSRLLCHPPHMLVSSIHRVAHNE